MQLLKVPDALKGTTESSVPYLRSRIPSPDEFTVLDPKLLNATVKLRKKLAGSAFKWAVAGDVGELLLGVNTSPDRLIILTTKDGCLKISRILADDQKAENNPKNVERELGRRASIASKLYPIRISSYFLESEIDEVLLEVHGDLRIRVGEWEWGDPLEFEPEIANVIGIRVPVMPLELKKDVYGELGWIDRTRKVNEALIKSHHRLGSDHLK